MTTISGHTTRANGTILTAAIYNADHLNHVANAVALDASKMEGATPPVADGHVPVFDGTSGAALRTSGFVPANATTVASDQAATTAALATKVAKAGDTMTGMLTISPGASNANAEWFQLKPTDFAAGKPYLFIKKALLPESFDVGLWDGTDSVGTINIISSIFQHLGNDLWSVASIATQAEALAGTVNTKPMTPLRTAEAIAAAVPAIINIGGAIATFDNPTVWDTGVVGSTGGMFFIMDAGSGNTLRISSNGGTNYTNAANTMGAGSLVAVKGAAALVIGIATPDIERVTLTAGAGNITFLGVNAQDFQGIRIL